MKPTRTGMNDMVTIEIFTKSTSQESVKLVKFLKAHQIEHLERVIDKDDNAKSDAIMLDIVAVPTLKMGYYLFRPKNLFNNGELIGDIKALLIETKKMTC
jgi:hypothetical protein